MILIKNSDISYGAKGTAGYTTVSWDGTKSKGILVDYTSAIKGPNITGFYAWIGSKSVTLASTTATIGFEGYGSQYVTFAGGQMRSFKKVPKLKLAYLATASYGKVYKETFLGTALIVGGMYDLKVNNRIDMKMMNLFIYSPYVSYFNDLVLKSPYVMLPSLGTNVAITKRFKFNINAGGAWIIKQNAINYTVTMGTRLLI